MLANIANKLVVKRYPLMFNFLSGYGQIIIFFYHITRCYSLANDH